MLPDKWSFVAFPYCHIKVESLEFNTGNPLTILYSDIPIKLRRFFENSAYKFYIPSVCLDVFFIRSVMNSSSSVCL